ncbi:MAG: hypothetical protein COU69_04385 [Candidatus Pacebacteria bacterium CG10_big_fil_rev_8_21_14_0_10_56_10]|nr:MAG: hypothetical protein COU69_04385 [Candidatus Pacebacteria bacterium CG10_big_fil_rev_8_21_14_0_10_56_10]
MTDLPGSPEYPPSRVGNGPDQELAAGHGGVLKSNGDIVKPKDLIDGDRVYLVFNGQRTLCKFVNINRLKFDNPELDHGVNPNVVFYRKTEPVKVRLAEGGEEYTIDQDGVPITVIAKPGQVIVQNNPDAEHLESSYIFGNQDETVAEQQARFEATYQQDSDRPGYYRRKKVIKAIRVEEPIAIRPGWDPDTLMGTPAGGVITADGYTISPSSLEASYEEVEPEQVSANLL